MDEKDMHAKEWMKSRNMVEKKKWKKNKADSPALSPINKMKNFFLPKCLVVKKQGKRKDHI